MLSVLYVWCACMHARLQVCRLACVWRPRIDVLYLPQLLSSSWRQAGSLAEPGLCQSQLLQPAGLLQKSPFCHPSAGIKGRQPYPPSICMGSRNLSPCPPTHWVGTLSTGSSSPAFCATSLPLWSLVVSHSCA